MDGMEQEQRFLSVLEGTTGFITSGDSLSLHGANGQLLLRFEAVFRSKSGSENFDEYVIESHYPTGGQS